MALFDGSQQKTRNSQQKRETRFFCCDPSNTIGRNIKYSRLGHGRWQRKRRGCFPSLPSPFLHEGRGGCGESSAQLSNQQKGPISGSKGLGERGRPRTATLVRPTRTGTRGGRGDRLHQQHCFRSPSPHPLLIHIYVKRVCVCVLGEGWFLVDLLGRQQAQPERSSDTPRPAGSTFFFECNQYLRADGDRRHRIRHGGERESWRARLSAFPTRREAAILAHLVVADIELIYSSRAVRFLFLLEEGGRLRDEQLRRRQP